MIDCISHGRLVSGWVRGHGSEQIFASANPAYNREYFQEAHDLILQAWTRPGPFRWEGQHFTYRYINPWVLPYQKPHPPIWIPGLLSPETAVWSARHRYPYLGLGTSLPETAELWTILWRGRGASRIPGRSRELRLPAARDRHRQRGESRSSWAGRCCTAAGRAPSRAPSIRCRRATTPGGDRRLARSMTAGIAVRRRCSEQLDRGNENASPAICTTRRQHERVCDTAKSR